MPQQSRFNPFNTGAGNPNASAYAAASSGLGSLTSLFGPGDPEAMAKAAVLRQQMELYKMQAGTEGAQQKKYLADSAKLEQERLKLEEERARTSGIASVFKQAMKVGPNGEVVFDPSQAPNVLGAMAALNPSVNPSTYLDSFNRQQDAARKAQEEQAKRDQEIVPLQPGYEYTTGGALRSQVTGGNVPIPQPAPMPQTPAPQPSMAAMIAGAEPQLPLPDGTDPVTGANLFATPGEITPPQFKQPQAVDVAVPPVDASKAGQSGGVGGMFTVKGPPKPLDQGDRTSSGEAKVLRENLAHGGELYGKANRARAHANDPELLNALSSTNSLLAAAPVIGGAVDVVSQYAGSKDAKMRNAVQDMLTLDWLNRSEALKGAITEREGFELRRSIPSFGADKEIWRDYFNKVAYLSEKQAAWENYVNQLIASGKYKSADLYSAQTPISAQFEADYNRKAIASGQYPFKAGLEMTSIPPQGSDGPGSTLANSVAPQPQGGETKVINGRTFIKQNGQWFEK